MIAAGLRKARNARRMSWQEWRLLLEAGSLALLIEMALRLQPFNRLLARLNAIGVGARKTWPRAACECAVDRAYRLLPLRRTCLKESLTLLPMLRRRGLDARLCLGVRREGDRLAAHAWIAQGGLSLEWDAESYGRLPIP